MQSLPAHDQVFLEIAAAFDLLSSIGEAEVCGHERSGVWGQN